MMEQGTLASEFAEPLGFVAEALFRLLREANDATIRRLNDQSRPEGRL